VLMGLVTAPLRAAAAGSRMALDTTAAVAGVAFGTALVAGEAVAAHAGSARCPNVGVPSRSATPPTQPTLSLVTSLIGILGTCER
jgi:hypothetical protein